MKHVKWLIGILLVLVMLTPSQTKAAGFTDVSTNHWAYESIIKLSNANIINGYSNGRFGPEDQITRTQAALLISRALNLSLETSYKPSYQDINSSSDGYKQIVALTEKGVFSDSTKFNPNDPLTRDQMAKVLVETYQIKMDSNHQVNFTDVSPSLTLYTYVTTVAEVGISRGVTPLEFMPKAAVSRAQMATFLDRAMTFNQKRESGVITYDESKKTYIDSSASQVSETAKETARLVNIERAKAGLSALVIDGQLSKIATIKAEDMSKNNYFAHTSPTYGSPWDMASTLGYSYRSFGENIAYGQPSPAEVVKAWMDSPGHKANILSKSYTNIGAGFTKNSQGRIYWVHMFSSK